MASNGIRKTLPPWALPVVIVVGVLLIGVVAWKAFTGTNSDNVPPVEVKSKMIDFQKEVRSGNLGRSKRHGNQ